MENHENLTERNKSLVRSFYEGGTTNETVGYGDFFHPDFEVTAPDYLPWGGTSKGAAAYLYNVLPQVAQIIDFSKLTFDSIIGEGERVVVVINVGVQGTDATIKISEHWVVLEEKARSLWVAYFQPKALLDQLEKINN